MPHTQILFRDDARARLLAGASILADAVRVTLGPHTDFEKAMFHARRVLDTMRAAISPGAVWKLRMQLPNEFQPLLSTPAES